MFESDLKVAFARGFHSVPLNELAHACIFNAFPNVHSFSLKNIQYLYLNICNRSSERLIRCIQVALESAICMGVIHLVCEEH